MVYLAWNRVLDTLISSVLTPSNRNTLNPKPLTWVIYRFCTDVTNKSASMIFIILFFFFFLIQGHLD